MCPYDRNLQYAVNSLKTIRWKKMCARMGRHLPAFFATMDEINTSKAQHVLLYNKNNIKLNNRS